MNKKYFYKIQDIEENTKYSEFYMCNKSCKTLINKAIRQYNKEGLEENVFYYIEEEFKKNKINFNKINFEVFEF